MADNSEKAATLKTQGNAAMAGGDYKQAIELYTEALEVDPCNVAIFSNRSMANVKKGDLDDALEDADRVISLKPEWSKGHVRKGQALKAMNRYEEAMMAFMEALDKDPTNSSIKENITECRNQLTGPGESQPILSPFADNNLWEKIRDDPNCRGFMADPDYKEKISALQKNPKLLGTYMQDSRIMTTLGMLLGCGLTLQDESAAGTGNGEEDMAASNTLDALRKAKEAAMNAFNTKPETNNAKKSTESPMETDSSENEVKALKEKDLGNAAYKKKDFETAISHYDKAIELDGKNITSRTNKSAVYYEQGEYDKCIAICDEAVEVGRENRVDYILIAKAFTRMGNAYTKKDDFENALKYFNKSLSEHRDPDVAKKVQVINKKKVEKERLAYHNPEIALEEKQKGNAGFTKGDYPTAIKHYTEAIKRNPEDAKIYSNRAACYTKLAEFPSALKDAETCIKLDPKFVKGYLRKGNVLLALKENSKAGDSFQKALEVDANCQEAIDGYRKSVMSESTNPEEVRKRAMQNPEVQQILADPAMQMILQQMQKDPKALQEHLKNPEVAKKIEKLLECGLIAIR